MILLIINQTSNYSEAMNWSKDRGKQSLSCDGKRLAELRIASGMNQAQFAKRAGYSVRLISKAENGRPIAITTIEDLAETLSTPDHPVTVSDLVTSPLEMGKRFIFGMYQHEGQVVEKLRDILHDEIIAKFAGNKKQIPFAGTHKGIEAVGHAFQRFFEILQSPEKHNPEDHYRFVAGGNRVVCWGHSFFHPRGGTPLPEPVDVTVWMDFVEGKMVFFEDRFNSDIGGDIVQKHLRMIDEDDSRNWL